MPKRIQRNSAQALARYRWMFKAALVTCGFGIALALIGIPTAFLSSPTLLLFGLFVALINALSGYRIVAATVDLLDSVVPDSGQRSTSS